MPWVVGTILVLVMTVMNWEWMPAILFFAYMIYGIARPWISRRWRAEIEQEDLPAADEGMEKIGHPSKDSPGEEILDKVSRHQLDSP